MKSEAHELCRAGRQLDEMGLSPGSSGNISIRVGDVVLMSPTNTSLGALDPEALSEFELADGALRHRGGPKPSKEYGLHEAIYVRDATANAVVHLHSTHAVAASCLPPWSEYSALPPLTPYLIMKLGNLPLVPYRHPGDAEQAQMLKDLEVPFHGALLQNHGPIVGGPSMHEAVQRAIEIEIAAETLVLLRTHRDDVHVLSHEEASELAERNARPWGLS